MLIKPNMAQGHLPKALQQNPRGGLEEVFDIPMETAPLPAGEYLIAEWTAKLSFPAFSLVGKGEAPVKDDGTPDPPTSWTEQTRWDWKPKEIDEVKIEVKPDIKPGDRVLVAWVNNHTDPIVISKVVSS